MKEEDADRIVLAYLQRKGYRHSYDVLRRETHVQSLEELTLSGSMDNGGGAVPGCRRPPQRALTQPTRRHWHTGPSTAFGRRRRPRAAALRGVLYQVVRVGFSLDRCAQGGVCPHGGAPGGHAALTRLCIVARPSSLPFSIRFSFTATWTWSRRAFAAMVRSRALVCAHENLLSPRLLCAVMYS